MFVRVREVAVSQRGMEGDTDVPSENRSRITLLSRKGATAKNEEEEEKKVCAADETLTDCGDCSD